MLNNIAPPQKKSLGFFFASTCGIAMRPRKEEEEVVLKVH